MTRSTLSSDNRTEINLPRCGSVYLVALEFPAGTLYTCTGAKAFTWGGHTYLPDGKVINVGGLSERGDGTQDPLVIVLSGADDDIYAALEADDWHFTGVRLWQLFLDDEHIAAGDPQDVGFFYMSHSNEKYSRETSTVELTCENALFAEGERVDAVLCDDVLHRLRSANDTYFENVLALIDREVIWAGLSQQTGGAGSGMPTGPNVINLPTPPPLPVPLPGDGF